MSLQIKLNACLDAHLGHTSTAYCLRETGIDDKYAESVSLAQRAAQKLKAGNLGGACADAKAALALNSDNEQAFGMSQLACRDIQTPKADPAKPEKKPEPPADDLQPRKNILDSKVQLPVGGPAKGQGPPAAKMSDREAALRSLATLKEDGNYPGVISQADEILKTEPGNSAALNAKALAQNHFKDYKGALVTAEQAIKASTANAAAYANKAFAEGALGKREEMIEDLRRAAEIDPRFEEALQKALASDAAGLFELPGEVRESGLQGTKAKDAGGANPEMIKWIVIAATVLPLMGLIIYFVLRNTVLKTPPPKPGTPWPTAPQVSRPASEPLGGKYDLGLEIGEGGMGMVFSGKDISLDRPVAIKKMLPQLAADPRMRARFVTEAKTVAALHHPNIVDIHAIVEDGKDIYLVFEYIAGKTLAELIASRGRFSPADAAKIIRDVAGALEFAHEKKIIHRDLKPSNIMVDERGLVKVMDFGLARAVKEFLSQSAATNHVVGTPAFMAPEQHLGESTSASDLFALGVCVYEMVTGQLPFKGPDFLVQKERMRFVPPTEVVPSLPKSLDGFMARALAAEPGKRFASARELAAAL